MQRPFSAVSRARKLRVPSKVPSARNLPPRSCASLTVGASPIAASRASAVEGSGKQATATQRAYTPEGLIYAAKAGGERLQLLRSFRPTFVQNFLWCYWALKAAILRFQLRSASLAGPYLIEKKGRIKNPNKPGIWGNLDTVAGMCYGQVLFHNFFHRFQSCQNTRV